MKDQAVSYTSVLHRRPKGYNFGIRFWPRPHFYHFDFASFAFFTVLSHHSVLIGLCGSDATCGVQDVTVARWGMLRNGLCISDGSSGAWLSFELRVLLCKYLYWILTSTFQQVLHKDLHWVIAYKIVFREGFGWNGGCQNPILLHTRSFFWSLKSSLFSNNETATVSFTLWVLSPSVAGTSLA